MPSPVLSLRTRVMVLALATAGAASLVLDALAVQAPPAGWFKGNTHTHTLNSDGDSTPDDVVQWYRSHRYHFLVLTVWLPHERGRAQRAPRRRREVPGHSR
jgi:hypothetical protein